MILWNLWKLLVFLSIVYMAVLAHQGYPLGYRRITGYEYDQTGKLVRRQVVWRLVFWLAVIALATAWFKLFYSPAPDAAPF